MPTRMRAPTHAPSLVDFSLDGGPTRGEALGYDDLGRMTRIGARVRRRPGKGPGIAIQPVDDLGRGGSPKSAVRGVADVQTPANDNLLREDHCLGDASGNRTLKIDRPSDPDKDESPVGATIYATPFYARPFDGRGTVELSQGSLPAVVLSPPINENEGRPAAHYLYSDLPSGSITSAVAVVGEPSKADATSIVRREYAPFGLELTSEELAASKNDDSHLPSVFHGKELDRVTNFSSFGARYYSRDLGMWLSARSATVHVAPQRCFWAGYLLSGNYSSV